MACGIEPRPYALGAWSLSHWTTREVPVIFIDMIWCLLCPFLQNSQVVFSYGSKLSLGSKLLFLQATAFSY